MDKGGTANGSLKKARFRDLEHIVEDIYGRIYVSEKSRIRQIDIRGGREKGVSDVSTFYGFPCMSSSSSRLSSYKHLPRVIDGPRAVAQFANIYQMCISKWDDLLYVIDSGRVRCIKLQVFFWFFSIAY